MTGRELVSSYLASFTSADPEVIVSHVCEEFENIQVGLLGTNCTGRETYRQRLKGFLENFKNLRYTIEEIIEADDRVAVAYKMNAEDNRRPIEIQGAMFFTIQDGLISRRNDYWDGLSYLKQAGINS